VRSVKTTMASETLLALGRYHLAALARAEQTQRLADGFRPAQDQLKAAAMTRAQAEEDMTDVRVGARFAEDAVETAIRLMGLQAHSVDQNNATGPAYKALFPEGMDTVLRPIGASQVEAALTLRGRLDTQPSAAKVKAQIMDDFDKALAGLRAALAKRADGEEKVRLTRAAEMGARESFASAYDSNIGALRQMFPRNQSRQNLYFDESGTTREPSAPAVEDETPQAASATVGKA
jgi:hypothetical protein